MTTARQPHLTPGQASVVYPETDGQPMGETDLHIIETIDLRLTLRRRFRDEPHVYVASNLLVYYEEGDPRKVFCPDVFVAFGVDPGLRRTYKLWEEGHPPAVVFEVSSRSTRREDVGHKKALCRRLGVREYYLYDPEGEYLEPPLQGVRLASGAYVPMAPDARGRLTSDALGLTLELEAGRLVLRVAATGERLLRTEERIEAAESENAHLREELRRLKGG